MTNNRISNVHYQKKWKEFSKTHFDQPAQKKIRRQRRAAKAARMFPRPTEALRPVVHCQTVKYNMRERLGRGFTLQELEAVGINRNYARTIGIAVDHRRVNRSQEALDLNVQRLKEYTSKLTVFPMKKATGIREATQHVGVVMPHVSDRAVVTVGTLPADRGQSVFKTLRNMRTEGRKKQ
ncbi:hypothetical protein RCL1_007177 [Eukaryota sp. TZLM3-RCL]